MLLTLTDKVAIVTGGAGALGRAVILTFLEAGALVAATDRDARRLDDVTTKLSAGARDLFLPVTTDVTDAASVQSLVADVVAQAGRLDVLVNVVGAFSPGDLVSTDEHTWDQMMTLNLKTAYLCCRAVVPSMITSGGGRIINVGARAAFPPVGGATAYTVAKAAVVALTQVLAEELRPHRITVNAVLPSTMDTPANRKAMPEADPARWVAPGTVAETICFLASDAAAQVTGALVPI